MTSTGDEAPAPVMSSGDTVSVTLVSVAEEEVAVAGELAASITVSTDALMTSGANAGEALDDGATWATGSGCGLPFEGSGETALGVWVMVSVTVEIRGPAGGEAGEGGADSDEFPCGVDG
jgi:hypothetical protein